VISLDLRRLAGLERLDEVSGEATFRAGTRAPAAEAALAERGFELGHFPQSFEFASLGGFAAMRSSGQNSAGHGRFDAMVTGLRVVTPTGTLDLGRAPGSAAGPDLVRAFLGSEGVFGVITQVRLRVHEIPAERYLDAFTFPDFRSGADALRRVTQAGTGPTVIRLSDEAETAVSLAQVGSIGKALSKGCTAVVLHEGPADLAGARRAATRAVLTAAGGRPASRRLAESWEHGRFSAPYLRDTLLEHGVFAETLETATTWSNLHALREAVTEALTTGFAAAGAKHRILCHISHVYPTGASLYFTVVAGLPGSSGERADGVRGGGVPGGDVPGAGVRGRVGTDGVRADMATAWEPVKARVNDAIMAAGGTISHHHGVGTDHAPWLEREIGADGVRVLRAIKRELDPAGILNPGTLLP
jgi:alkyldihydroxyacetonephosphate synthase